MFSTKLEYSMIVLVMYATSCCVLSLPAHNGMMFYRAPPRYSRSGHYPYHQAMLVHYGKPSRRNAQLPSSEVAAFAAGDAVGTGSLLQESGDQNDFQQEPIAPQGDRNALSIAEAYPESFNIPLPDQPSVAPVDDQPLKNDVIPESDLIPVVPQLASEPVINDQVVQSEHETAVVQHSPVEVAPHELELPANDFKPSAPVAPVAPVAPAAPPSKKKKTRVELNDDDDESDDFSPFNGNNKGPNKGSNGNGNGNWPLNSFFPLNFGSTSGGAIAVANSFSTGKGGTATSHATAYGSGPRPKSKTRPADE